MKPLLRARLQSRCSRGFTLACDDDATIRVTALQPDLVRVTLLRGGEVRQQRTWSVPACGESDTPWAGRTRLDDSSWPAVPLELTATEAELSLVTQAMRLTVRLDPLRMDWALSNGTTFASDREIQPYFLGQKTHARDGAPPGGSLLRRWRQDRPARSPRPSPALRDVRFARVRSPA